MLLSLFLPLALRAQPLEKKEELFPSFEWRVWAATNREDPSADPYNTAERFPVYPDFFAPDHEASWGGLISDPTDRPRRKKKRVDEYLVLPWLETHDFNLKRRGGSNRTAPVELKKRQNKTKDG